jgi:hypothetical protein
MGFLLVDRRGRDVIHTSCDLNSHSQTLFVFGEKFPNYITFLFFLLPFLSVVIIMCGSTYCVWLTISSPVITCVETGGRVSPLSPGVVFFKHLSIIVDIPSTSSFYFLDDTWNKKKWGEKITSCHFHKK